MNDGSSRGRLIPPVSRRLLLVPILLFGLFAATGFAPPFEMNGDTSWLITVVERLRTGERAYVDVLETNPPMAFLIYWPAVALGSLTGLSPEVMVYVETGLIAAASLLLIHVIVRRHIPLADGGMSVLLAALAIVYLLLPSRTFTQREHLALMLLLPAVFCVMVRSAGGRPAVLLAATCGMLAGIGASIKPHFVLVVALPVLAAVAAQRDWRLFLVPEALVAGALFAAYAAFWVTYHGAFFDLPLFLTSHSYRLYRGHLRDVLGEHPWFAGAVLAAVMAGIVTSARRQHLIVPLTAAAIALLIAALEPGKIYVLAAALAGIVACAGRERLVVPLAAALIAFLIAYLEQDKGFAYHLYPVVGSALILVIFVMALPANTGTRIGERLYATVILMSVLTVGAYSFAFSKAYPDSRELRQAIAAIKPRPSLIILTFDIAVNFPLARQLEATWASRLQSTWISNSAAHALSRNLRPAQRELTLRTIAIEREIIGEDVARNRPDILVFDRQVMLDHMRKSDTFRAAFDGAYAPARVAQSGRFLIYRRNAP